MNEFQYIRDKYKNKDFIEITQKEQMKLYGWISGKSLNSKDDIYIGGKIDIRDRVKRLSQRGFIKFINDGVLIIKSEIPNDNIRYYPFQFTDNNTLHQSIYISNPYSNNPFNSLELLCKVEVGTDTRYTVIDGTYNDKLAIDHMANEFEQEKIGTSTLLPIIRDVKKTHPHLTPRSAEWRIEVTKEYFRTIAKAQILTVISLNAYLALYQKDKLYTRIEQVREYKAGNSDGKRGKRNPFYRYVVSLPENYKPRKFDLNYIISEWNRSGHITTRWVLPENAELLAKRKNGKLTNRTKGKYVAIEIPIEPQLCHRKVVSISSEKIGVKTYQNG